jgi:hypothetical protein
LETRVRDYALHASVQMLGTVDHQRWLEILAACDLFLLPSQYEGISVALLEAMAMGAVPVVAAVGGQSEALSAECGFLVPHGAQEISAYADALSLLIGDAQRRSAMASAARARILAEFTHERSIARLLETLQRARCLALEHPRQRLAPGLALELATLAIDYTRLNILADELWRRTHPGSAVLSPLRGEVVRVLKWALDGVRATRAGAWILSIPLVHGIGRRLRRVLGAPAARRSSSERT